MANEKLLIDANKLMDAINFEYDLNYGEILTDPRRFADMVEDAPTVEAVEVVHGWWIELPSMEPDYKCSECGQFYAWWEPNEAHYCPNCGAKMDGDGNENV